MGYIRIRMIKGVAMGVFVALCLTGCGSRSASETENYNGKLAEKAGDASGENNLADTVAADESKKLAGTAEADNSAGVAEKEITYTELGLPVYGKENKDKLKEYMASLPDKVLSFEEIKAAGMISCGRIFYSKKENKYFEDKWFSFLEATREFEKIEKDRSEGKAVHDIGLETALLILRYTIEGDPIYDYISYINGEYYWYSDNSRDEFGGGKYYGSYEEIRENANHKERYTDFYLVKDSKMSAEKMKKMLDDENGYDTKDLTLVYSVDYLVCR